MQMSVRVLSHQGKDHEMKKLIWLVLACVVAGSAVATAQDLSRGRNELALSGSIRLDEPDPIKYQVFLDLKYGRYIRDQLQIGGYLNVFANDVNWTISIGPQVEYTFLLGNRWPRLSRWAPYVGLGAALATAEIDDDWSVDVTRDGGSESRSGVTVNGEAGVKYFLSDSVAISSSFNFAWSSDDVFSGRSDMKHILLGIRSFF